MAYQKDYVLRMLEQIGEIIAKLKGLLEENQHNAASEQSDLAIEKIFGKSISLVNIVNQSPETILESLEGDVAQKCKRAELLSDLLVAYATHTHVEEQKLQLFSYALQLLKLLPGLQTHTFDLSLEKKIRHLEAQIVFLKK